jgi:hypothetical protein
MGGDGERGRNAGTGFTSGTLQQVSQTDWRGCGTVLIVKRPRHQSRTGESADRMAGVASSCVLLTSTGRPLRPGARPG